MSDFTPISIVKKRPTWMTPDFNPQIADKNTKFTPFSVVTSPYYAKSNTGRYLDTNDMNIRMGEDFANVYKEFPDALTENAIAGYVNEKFPGQMYLNPKTDNKFGFPSLGEVYVHEKQHDLDNKRGMNINTLLENRAPTGANYRDTSKDFAKLNANIKTAYNKYQKKYKLAGDFTERGLFAELKRIESTLPVGKNIFDTDIGKEISKDLPFFKLGYFNQTRPTSGTYMYSLETGLGE